MNISTILIVAIALNAFILTADSTVQGNSSQLSFNINVQSPQAVQSHVPPVSCAEGFLKTMHDVEWEKAIQSQWKKYRLKFLISMVGLSYGYLWYQLYQARKILTHAQAWCCWKDHIDIDRFIHCNRDDLTRELLTDIQERYINSVNPTDFVHPFASFLPTLEKEKQMLELYIWWGRKLMTSRIQWLFPVNKHYIEMASKALSRLQFIKNIFVVWLAHHNSLGGFAK